MYGFVSLAGSVIGFVLKDTSLIAFFTGAGILSVFFLFQRMISIYYSRKRDMIKIENEIYALDIEKIEKHLRILVSVTKTELDNKDYEKVSENIRLLLWWMYVCNYEDDKDDKEKDLHEKENLVSYTYNYMIKSLVGRELELLIQSFLEAQDLNNIADKKDREIYASFIKQQMYEMLKKAEIRAIYKERKVLLYDKGGDWLTGLVKKRLENDTFKKDDFIIQKDDLEMALILYEKEQIKDVLHCYLMFDCKLFQYKKYDNQQLLQMITDGKVDSNSVDFRLPGCIYEFENDCFEDNWNIVENIIDQLKCDDNIMLLFLWYQYMRGIYAVVCSPKNKADNANIEKMVCHLELCLEKIFEECYEDEFLNNHMKTIFAGFVKNIISGLSLSEILNFLKRWYMYTEQELEEKSGQIKALEEEAFTEKDDSEADEEYSQYCREVMDELECDKQEKIEKVKFLGIFPHEGEKIGSSTMSKKDVQSDYVKKILEGQRNEIIDMFAPIYDKCQNGGDVENQIIHQMNRFINIFG